MYFNTHFLLLFERYFQNWGLQISEAGAKELQIWAGITNRAKGLQIGAGQRITKSGKYGLHIGAVKGLQIGAKGLQNGAGITTRGKRITNRGRDYKSGQGLQIGAAQG